MSHSPSLPPLLVGSTFVTHTDADFSIKNPINKGSKDPLRPPSRQEHFTIFSGVPIHTLSLPLGKSSLLHAARLRAEASSLTFSPWVIAAGHATAKVDWRRLHALELDAIGAGTPFGNALLWLHAVRANEPYIHTNLYLEEWLAHLRRIGTVESADCFWALSRGIQIIPPHPSRAPTRTPNYNKPEDESHMIQEFERVMRSGYICTWKELRTVYPDLQEWPTDILGTSVVIKERDEIDIQGNRILKVRIIIDASRPTKRSVNDFCPESSTTLPTVIEMGACMIKNTWAALGDISDAFHNVALSPKSWANVSMILPGPKCALEKRRSLNLIAYHRLAFGIASAVRIFQGLATLIQDMLKQDCIEAKIDHLIYFTMVYIDDFLALAHTKAAAAKWLLLWIARMDSLGLPWKLSKIVEPTQEFRILGIMASTTKMILWIDQDRVDETFCIIDALLLGNTINLKETQQVMGKLNFISTVIRFAKLFSRGLALLIIHFNTLGRPPPTRLALPSRVIQDLKMWGAILTVFNGKDVNAPANYPAAPCGMAESDASYWGGGWFCSGQYGHVTWKELGYNIFGDDGMSLYSTSFVEALALRELLRAWAPVWSGQYVRLVLDNEGLGAMMCGEKTKSEQVLPILMDCIALVVAYELKPRIIMLPSEQMIYSDPLSRWNHPLQADHYRKLFKRNLKEFHLHNTTWTPPAPERPRNAHALKLREQWESFRSS